MYKHIWKLWFMWGYQYDYYFDRLIGYGFGIGGLQVTYHRRITIAHKIDWNAGIGGL